MADYIVWCAGKLKERVRHKDADKDHKDAANDGSHNRSVHGIAYFRFVLSPVISCDKYVCSDRKTDEQIDKQIDKCTCGTDGCKRVTSGKASDNDDIRCIEQKLKNSGEDQRPGKDQDLPEKRSVAHVHFIRFFHVSIPRFL